VEIGASERSRSLAIVVLQQSTQPLLAPDLGEWQHIVLRRRSLRFFPPQLAAKKQAVVFGLMWPLLVIMLQPLHHEVVEVPLAKNHQVIQALLLDRLN
jgi:hypothetical protein